MAFPPGRLALQQRLRRRRAIVPKVAAGRRKSCGVSATVWEIVTCKTPFGILVGIMMAFEQPRSRSVYGSAGLVCPEHVGIMGPTLLAT